MSGFVYHLLFGITIFLLFIAVIVLYKIIVKKKRFKTLFGLLAALIGMLGVVLSYNPPQEQDAGSLSADVDFFSRTYAIEDRTVYKTLLSNSFNFGAYELKYTIHNNFDEAVKIDSLSLLVDSYEAAEAELISPEGGGGGDTGFVYYYGKLEGKKNPLTYLGTEYGNFDLSKDKESYVKIEADDLEAATVYFDCDKPGLYEFRLNVGYSGRTRGNYISEPLKIYVIPYELEQDRAKVLSDPEMLLLLDKLSEKNDKMGAGDYENLQQKAAGAD